MDEAVMGQGKGCIFLYSGFRMRNWVQDRNYNILLLIIDIWKIGPYNWVVFLEPVLVPIEVAYVTGKIQR
jgi:hypothetical protein